MTDPQTPSLLPSPAAIQFPSQGEQIVHDGRVYFLGAELGEGYFGKVYNCSDRWANDLVAKILLPKGRSYQQVRAEWLRELQSLLTLRHPSITFAYDAFEYRNTFYLIVERCGSDLNELFKVEGLNGNMWLPTLARDLLQAVEYVHRANYVHKDIHPGNVFVSWSRDRMIRDREPVLSFKLGDLGISRLETEIDAANTILAKWILPPEAMQPTEFGVLGRTVDIYHTGLVFLSLLLGRVPEFTKEEVLAGKPRELAEGLSSPYSAPIACALRRHAACRYQSAAEFWQAIVEVMPQEMMPK